MSDKTIEFEHEINNVLTAVTSVVLRDASAAWGVRHVGTGAVVVAAGTALIADGAVAGRYTKTITGLTPGELYEYALEWVYEGDTDRTTKTFTAPGDGAEGLYVGESDIADLIGEENLQIASELEGSVLTVNSSRVQRAINWAEAEVHRYIRRAGIFMVPLAGLDTDSALLIKLAAAELAAWWLAHNRGIKGIDFTGDPAQDIAAASERKRLATWFDNMKKHALEFLDELQTNPRMLKADKYLAATRHVSVGAGSAPCRVAVPVFPIPPLMP